MITRHGPIVATEIQDGSISTGKIAASAVTSPKLNSTALDLHIARGTQTGKLATAGVVAVDTGLTSPVVAIANVIGSGSNAGKNCRIGFGRFSVAYAIFSLMSKVATSGTAAQPYVAAASSVSRSVAWAAWET